MLIVQRDKEFCVMAVYASGADVLAVPARYFITENYSKIAQTPKGITKQLN